MKRTKYPKGTPYRHELLKQADKEQEPNVTALCRRLDISRAQYYNVINGKHGSPALIAAISRELGLDPADVLRLPCAA